MSDADSVGALGHGVCAIFLNSSPPDQLSQAIRRVMAGETWIDERCIHALVRALDRSRQAETRRQLSERERDVLKGVFEGLSNKEIAATLKLSQATVKSPLHHPFITTAVPTRT